MAVEWQPSLYLAGGGWWRGRIRIVVTNAASRAAEGQPAVVRIGSAMGEADLAGQRAEAIRLCNEQGVEMLFAIHGPNQDLVTRGPIPAGSTLVVPAECREHRSAVYYVYFDNPDAGEVPDYFTAKQGLLNGDLEQGESPQDADAAPAEWVHDPADAQHRASWSTENPQSGRRCLKTVVAEGAEPSWIATRQHDIRVIGGAKYRIRAWVKAENVKGNAGWYTHVGNARDSMLLNTSLNGGGGTYGWKEVTVEFTAPAETSSATVGTVLRGTGTAWFDNVRWECLEPDRLGAVADRPERMTLADAGQSGPWYGGESNDYDHRAAVRIMNFSPQATAAKLFTVDAAMIAARSRGGLADCLVIDELRKPIRVHCLEGRLLFEADVPGRSVRTCYVYWRGDRTLPLHAANTAGKPVGNNAVPSRFNLVKNGDFALGGASAADWWHDAAPAGSGIEFAVERADRAAPGKRWLRMRVPAGSPSAWRGWHQRVPVQSGHSYLVSAWIKYKDFTKSGKFVHVHQLAANGTVGAMGNAGPNTQGASDWTFVAEQMTAAADTACFELHLTMNRSGTVWYRGVAVTEVTPATIGREEGRPAKTPAQLDVWQVPAVVKVFEADQRPHAAAALRITAARNEQEPLQLAIRAGRRVPGARVEVDPPRGPNGAKLGDVEINVVGYVPIDYPTAYYSQMSGTAWRRMIPTGAATCDGWAGRWPDPLLPNRPFDLAADTTQPMWITVTVPKGAPAGDYTGTVRLIAGRERLWQQPFTLHVWDFTLPEEKHVGAKFDVGPGLGEKWWGEPWKKARRQIIAMMAKRRLCPDEVEPQPEFKYENGKATADFTKFDRAATRYFDELKLPYAWTPNFFYAFGWGFPPRALFGEEPYAGKSPFENVDRGQLRPEYKKAYQACLKLFWEHVKQKGWDKKFVLYICDEPHYWLPPIIPQMKALCQMIHEVDRQIPIYSSTWNYVPQWDDSLDIWGIGHYGCVPVEQIAKLRAAGHRVWWTTDGQMCTDTPYCAVERLLPHYCFKYGVEAYEFWGVSWTTYDPHRFGWHVFIPQSERPGHLCWIRYPNGDGFLMYPGHSVGCDGPLSSIRLEQAREGVEDYEYLYLLRQLTQKAKAAGKDVAAAERALARADRLVTIPNAGGCYSSKIVGDPEEIYRVKEEVGRAIEGLTR
jgi:hypothetical protein